MFSHQPISRKDVNQNFTTPVLLLGFNRPEKIQRVFDVIARQKPLHLYVALDGPRSSVPLDNAKCEAVKRIVETVDWDCNLQMLTRPVNLGCKNAIETGISWFFGKVEHGIVLEDDCLPDDSFFSYCESLLERYRTNERVMCISGNNFNSCCVKSPDSYYFSKYMHCWGWATWRRAWVQHIVNLEADSRDEDVAIVSNYRASIAEIQYWCRRFDRVRSGRINSWDYGWQRSIWQRRGLIACPQVNLVENIGHGSDATHTTKSDLSASPQAKSLTIQSHPPSVEQDLLMDDHEASNIYRFDQRTLWSRCRREVSNFFQKLPLHLLTSPIVTRGETIVTPRRLGNELHG